MNAVQRLHLISNRAQCPVGRFPEVARAAALGGVDAVHVREADLSEDELSDLVVTTRHALFGTGCRVLVNRRIEIAESTGADGVQLPESSALGPAAVRERISGDSLIGVSVHSPKAAIEAERQGADFVLAGHVFETGSKPGQPGRGLSFVAEVSDAVRIPVVAIGGIRPENVAQVVEAGAWGVAVLSTILLADDPTEMAGRYDRILKGVKVRNR